MLFYTVGHADPLQNMVSRFVSTTKEFVEMKSTVQVFNKKKKKRKKAVKCV